jgi:DNA repair protein RadC
VSRNTYSLSPKTQAQILSHLDKGEHRQAIDLMHDQMKQAYLHNHARTAEEAVVRLASIAAKSQEHFAVLSLDQNGKIIAEQTVSIGLLNRAMVHPREVYASAIAAGATSIIVSHNHPSRNLQPSEEDKSVSDRLTKAGKALGIAFDDHLVVSNSSEGITYYSFANDQEKLLGYEEIQAGITTLSSENKEPGQQDLFVAQEIPTLSQEYQSYQENESLREQVDQALSNLDFSAAFKAIQQFSVQGNAESKINGPDTALSATVPYLDRDSCDQYIFVTLDGAYQVIGGYELDHHQSEEQAVSQIFRQAIADRSAAIFTAHHVGTSEISGDPEKSSLTEHIIKSSDVIGITHLDHLTVSRAPEKLIGISSRGEGDRYEQSYTLLRVRHGIDISPKHDQVQEQGISR